VVRSGLACEAAAALEAAYAAHGCGVVERRDRDGFCTLVLAPG
jgi:hypothetical protein